jgi:Tfp pilus assembly protein PilO
MRGKRAPILVGAAAGALALLLIFFLVLPKLSEISEAKSELADAKAQEATLRTQVAALNDAKAKATEARATIAEVKQQIPEVADEPGLINLLHNAAIGAGLQPASFSPSTPVLDPVSGLSTITVAVNATGTYYDVAEFLFRIETMRRAAKVTQLSLAPGGQGDTTLGTVPELSLTCSIDLYTSDTSAGPGSIPGATTEAPPGA